MSEFTPIASTIGGVLIGIASLVLLVLNGRIAGISGILGGLGSSGAGDRAWRVAFLAGMLGGGLVALAWMPTAFGTAPASLPVLVLAGLLVGFGTRMGSGCTSGHGVCGLSRLSPRSMVATLTFITAGAMTVFAVRHLGS
jgi:uncharacterized protein